MRALVAGVSLALCIATPALAQQEADDRTRLEELRATPGSGDVEDVRTVQGHDTQIAPSPDEARRKERRVPTVESASDSEERVAAPAGGSVATVAPAQLDALDARLRGCRNQVAAERETSPRRIPAGKVTVRFVVLPDGTVDAPEAVAETRTDSDVLSCVKRTAGEARFAPPVSGRVSVNRRLVF